MNRVLAFTCTALAFFAATFHPTLAHAVAYNITIPDGIGQSGSQGDWYGGAHEDQEVEPGNQTGQKWDLEGFFLDGSILTIVGGFNFKTGESGSGMTFSSGDIFIDVDGDVTYGQSSSQASNGYLKVSNSLFGYDYVYHLTFNNTQNKYTLYSLDEDSTLKTQYYKENSESGPYQYISGGQKETTGTFTVTELQDDDPLLSGLQGDTHYALSLNLADFLLDEGFTVHYTIGCGNDSLMGEYQPSSIIPPLDIEPVPEPATMALLLTGLMGLAIRQGIRRAVNQ